MAFYKDGEKNVDRCGRSSDNLTQDDDFSAAPIHLVMLN